MAGKSGSGMAWSASQGEALLEATQNAVNKIQSKYDEATEIFSRVRSDEVIGDSDTKTALVKVLDECDAVFKTLLERLAAARKLMSDIYDALNAGAKQNKENTADSEKNVADAKNKMATANGTGN